MSTNHRLERSFQERPVFTAFGVTVGSFLFSGAGRALGNLVIPKDVYQDQLSAAAQQVALAVLTLVLLRQRRWLRTARITSRPSQSPSWWAWTCAPAALIPMIGLADVDWNQGRQIVVSTLDFVSRG